MVDRIHVAVGIIYNESRDKVLISKRKINQHLAGLWEFPGGKLRQEEDARIALDRELFEELGIVVKQANRLKTIKHDYPDKKVLLDIWTINEWTGDVTAREGQELAWVYISKLSEYQFPEANNSIISLITLPSIYLISKDHYEDKECFLSFLEKCFSSGVKLFQLRLKSIEIEEFKPLVQEIKSLSVQYNVKFILNGTIKDVEVYNIDGIHLNSKELFNYTNRPIIHSYILGASCHNEEELIQAIKINADYVFISPVLSTKSHVNQDALGWEKFNNLCNKLTIPVYALGGMGPKDKKNAISNGAHGIAMISSIWDSSNPIETIKLCIN